MTLPAYVTQVLLDAPSGLWLLADAAGAAVAADSNPCLGGPRNAGTVHATVTFGSSGPVTGLTAAIFDGVSGYVDVPFNPVLNPPVWSVETLLNFAVNPGSNAAIYDCRPANSGANAAGFMLAVDINGHALFITDAANQSQSQIGGSTALSGAWHHMVGTYDGANGRLYVDGSLIAGPTAMLYTPNPSHDGGIAHNWLGGTAFFAASLFAVAVYANTLSGLQVANHYNAWQQANQEIYVPLLPGIQPWAVPSFVSGISGWTGEVYAGGGFGTPPALGALIAEAVQIASPTYKYWILDSAVNPLG